MTNSGFQDRAEEYARRRDLTLELEQSVGAGTDGHVWATHHKTVIKVFERNLIMMLNVAAINDSWNEGLRKSMA